MLRRVREIPGVLAAGHHRRLAARPQPHLGRAGERGDVRARKISLPLCASSATAIPGDGNSVAGRPRHLTERDTPSSEPVIVLNETMARALWPGEDPIGQDRLDSGQRGTPRSRRGGRRAAHLALEQGSGNEMYLPMRQCGDHSSADLVVRSKLPPADLASAVRAALQPIAPNLPGNDFRTLQQLVDKAVSPRRFVVLLLGGFALFALLLASLGIYGVISYSVSQRAQEIGIRMALGASARAFAGTHRDADAGLAGIGMAVGAAASWVLARTLSGMLFGVTATDPATFAGMLLVLGTVAAVRGISAGPPRIAHRSDDRPARRVICAGQ